MEMAEGSMATPRARPIVMQPLLEEKPWGSRRLADMGLVLPETAAIGEALYTAPQAEVASGPFAGRTLGGLARSGPEAWVGERGLAVTGGQAIFPLLVKLIDATMDLSIQVHPNHAMAAATNLGTGKTEAWHILAAERESVIYAGLTSPADAEAFASACARADGSSARYLRAIPARPGMTIVVPAGTPHAIGAGILLYEIQQPSNVTFRLDDWGRTDDRGVPRALHLDLGLAAVDPASRPEPAPRVTLREDAPRRELLAATRYFALERIALEGNEHLLLPPAKSPSVLTCLAGSALIESGDGSERLAIGQTAIVLAGCAATLRARQGGLLLRGWVPDLDQEVIAPALKAGATHEELARLGVAAGA